MQCANPEKKLNENEVAESSGDVERGTRVCLAVRCVDMVLLTVCQHQDRITNVLTSNGVHQLLYIIQHDACGGIGGHCENSL